MATSLPKQIVRDGKASLFQGWNWPASGSSRRAHTRRGLPAAKEYRRSAHGTSTIWSSSGICLLPGKRHTVYSQRRPLANDDGTFTLAHLGLQFPQPTNWRLGSAADTIALPQPEPRGLCASVSSCRRFAAARSLALSGLV